MPDLATNVMTLTVTGLVAEWSLVGGDNQHAGRRATSLGLFSVRAVLGAYLTRFGVEWPLPLATVIFTLAPAGHDAARPREPASPIKGRPEEGNSRSRHIP